jgi:hypothetical protein
MGVCDAYYEGDQRLAFATAKFREAFGALFSAVADNWMPIVVDSKSERLKVQGFRFGTAPGADQRAWDIWQANGMDAASDGAHRGGQARRGLLARRTPASPTTRRGSPPSTRRR